MKTESPNLSADWQAWTVSALKCLAILLIGLATITTNCADPDLWGHVQYGREVLRDGVLPRTATWSYVAENAPWVNHENIAEFLLAWTVDTFGPSGLPWMKLSLAAVMLVLMIVSARRSGAGWLATGILVLLVASNVQFHWHFRPQILTYLSLAVMLTLWQFTWNGLHRGDQSSIEACVPRLKILWLLVPLMCFWANSHGGFAAGLAIMVTHHFLTCLQVVKSSGWVHKRLLILLSLVTIAASLATLVNPYGIGLWKFMLAALELPRPEIEDWGPLELWSFEAVRFWCLISVAGLGLWINRSRRDLTQLVILGLLLWQGVSHCRHLSIFAIVCGFWIPRHLHQVLLNVESTLRKMQPNAVTLNTSPGFPGVFALLLLMALSLGKLAPLMKEVPVERSEFPVSAMQYLHDQQLHGRTLVTFNWAQYAIGCFAADNGPLQKSRVAVDGRFETCYPRVITDICFDFWLGTDDRSRRYRSPDAPEFNPHIALEFERPDLVLISRDQRPSVQIIEQHRDEWTLLYQDSLAQIWGRRCLYDDPVSPTFVPASEREISEDRQTGTVPWPAFPQHRSDRNHVSTRHDPAVIR